VPFLRLLAAPLVLAAPLAAQLDLPGKPAPRPKEPGEALLPPEPPRGDLAPKPPGTPLDLPGVAVEPPPEAPLGAVEALFLELANVRSAAATEALRARLTALGPAVLPRARLELLGEHGPSVLVAGRLCLALGTSAERAAVAERLTRPVAPDVAVALLEELRRRDPVLVSPEYLAGLIDHPSTPLRAHATQLLQATPGGVPLPALAPLFSSKRLATRSAALELIGSHADPLALNLLASRLGDSSAQLARRAAELLATRDEAEALLQERAFPPAERPSPIEWTRARAYAVLALVEREERRGLALLEGAEGQRDGRIESLRAGLTSSQPLVAGAAAVALARIGFRASAAECGPWLEREVPHLLVRSGTGAEFHADFSALERPAQRALALLSGEGFGADGEAWRAWWVASATGFRARHARIELGPDAAEQLLVGYRTEDGRELLFLGPGRALPPEPGLPVRLGPEPAARLLAELSSAGVFGPERLPTARRGGEVALRVAVGAAEKAFAPAPGEAWRAPLFAELERLLERERWQLHCEPALLADPERFRIEAERWAGLEPLARARALVALLIGRLQRTRGAQRDEPLAELERLYEDAGVPVAEDFAPLLAVLAAEPAFQPRAAHLFELARIAAGPAEAQGLEPDARERLLALGLERFGPEADAALARLARDLAPEVVAGLVADSRPRARALGAHGLVRHGRPGELELVRLRALLADPEPSVALALLAALQAESDAELGDALRDELLRTAREAPAEARIAALAVLGRLGGRGVRDAALEAVADAAVEVQTAGVAALAELADPSSASLLASLYVRGPASPHHAAARRGLRALGPEGRAECLRLARSASVRTRREAALFLSETLDPAAAGLLLECLATDPADERVLWELGVLAGIDFAAQAHPPTAVAAWWDLVVHDDPLAWLVSAAARLGLTVPAVELLRDGNRVEAAHFWLELVARSEPELVERGARELELQLGRELARPAGPLERARFVAELEEAVRARFGE